MKKYLILTTILLLAFGLRIYGLTEFAIRLPSAIFGTLAVLGIYLLARRTDPNESAAKDKGSVLYGLISAAVLALMPWHIHFSRGAWEVNVFVTLLLFSIYFFLRFFRGRSLWPALVLALFAFFTYQGAKLLTPLIFAGYRPPLSPEVRVIDGFNQLSLNLFHHQLDLHARMFASRYLYHFSPDLLFYEGTDTAQVAHLPRLSLLYITDAFWLFLGLISLAGMSFRAQSRNLLLLLLLLSPLPASLTLAEYAPIRALFMVIPFSLIIALGIAWLWQNHRFLLLLFLPIHLAFVILALDLYYYHSTPAVAEISVINLPDNNLKFRIVKSK